MIVARSSLAKAVNSSCVRSWFGMAENVAIAEPAEESEIKDLIAAAIYRRAPGNVEEMAQAILTELNAAGFQIHRSTTIDPRDKYACECPATGRRAA